MRGAPSEGAPRSERPDAEYLERALLLWPRLDRARLRRYADNPTRIAEFVARRTSQPLDVILAMLTRQAVTPLAPAEPTARIASGAVETARIAIHIVRDDEDGLEALVLA